MRVSDVVQSFESSLMILRNTKNGWVIGFSVHPNEIPELLLRVPLGTRYQIALVQIGDDEQPTLPQNEHIKSVSIAGQLCRNSDFQNWYLADIQSDDAEKTCTELLRKALGITSRSELATNEAARTKLENIIRDWKGDLDGGFEID